MNGNFNKGAWKKMENKLAEAAAAGKKVEVKIEVNYGGAGGRPDGFRVTYSIDGVRSTRNFENKPGG
jgi:DNA/RNA non-specific endonuclease